MNRFWLWSANLVTRGCPRGCAPIFHFSKVPLAIFFKKCLFPTNLQFFYFRYWKTPTSSRPDPTDQTGPNQTRPDPTRPDPTSIPKTPISRGAWPRSNWPAQLGGGAILRGPNWQIPPRVRTETDRALSSRHLRIKNQVLPPPCQCLFINLPPPDNAVFNQWMTRRGFFIYKESL